MSNLIPTKGGLLKVIRTDRFDISSVLTDLNICSYKNCNLIFSNGTIEFQWKNGKLKRYVIPIEVLNLKRLIDDLNFFGLNFIESKAGVAISHSYNALDILKENEEIYEAPELVQFDIVNLTLLVREVITGNNIFFEFEGKNYKISGDVIGKDTLQLPDGRILGVESWSNDTPPKPTKLTVIDHIKAAETVYVNTADTRAEKINLISDIDDGLYNIDKYHEPVKNTK